MKSLESGRKEATGILQRKPPPPLAWKPWEGREVRGPYTDSCLGRPRPVQRLLASQGLPADLSALLPGEQPPSCWQGGLRHHQRPRPCGSLRCRSKTSEIPGPWRSEGQQEYSDPLLGLGTLPRWSPAQPASSHDHHPPPPTPAPTYTNKYGVLESLFWSGVGDSSPRACFKDLLSHHNF